MRHDCGVLFDRIIRPALYRLAKSDPERVHERTVAALSAASRSPRLLRLLHGHYGTDAPRTVFGTHFPGPVGLAAGMDKDGTALHTWPALGFGFVEVGTVTRYPQPGNPKPRLFHLPHSDAVINRMGFNNCGADALAAQLATHGKPDVPLGVSIGKSKATRLDDAVSDYQHSMRALEGYADYFAVNVSSPNTPGLRSLQDRTALAELLGELRDLSTSLAEERGAAATPILVKLAPDLTEEALTELLEVCIRQGVAGLIATNTTLDRSRLEMTDAPHGGLSGRPLTARAQEVVRFVRNQTAGALPIIGVGGIMDADDAERMIDAGASLVQLYTGFALHGPAVVRSIGRRLASGSAQLT